MIDHFITIAVVARGQIFFRHRHADGVGKSLTQRPGGDFDAWCQSAFRVARRHAAPTTKLSQLFKWQRISSEVKQAI